MPEPSHNGKHPSPLSTASWSPKTGAASEKAAKPERSRPFSAFPDTRSNILTLLIAVAIIVGGYLLPTLLYPLMDQYREQTLVLKDATTDTLTTHVFDEPLSLYPWNLSAPEEFRGLTASERSLLSESGVPDFLLAAMRDRGLTLPLGTDGQPAESAYREAILEGFQYLYVKDESSPDCLVLINADINGDGVPDFSCAVDLSGAIISLLFLSPEWDTVRLTADDYLPPSLSDAEGGDAGASGGGGANTPDAGGDAAAPNTVQNDEGGTGTEMGTDAGAGAGTGDGTGAGAEKDAATDGSQPADEPTAGGQDGQAGPPNLEYLPVEEDENLWSFAYATMLEAQSYGQFELASVFDLMNENYQYRYGYSFRLYLLFQGGGSAEAGVAANDFTVEKGQLAPDSSLLYPLTPTTFGTAENELYIYDLPEGVRLILYLDPATKRCVGFNVMPL